MTGPLGPRDRAFVPDELEGQVERLLARAYEIAAGYLEGINEAANELAQLADDRRVIEGARRMVADRMRSSPNRAHKQVASLIRRSIERGDWRWTWDDTAPVP